MAFPPPNDRQARILWASVTALAVAVLLGLLGILAWGFGWVLNRLSSVLMPLAIAGVLAYLLDPLVDAFERKGLPRARAILAVFGMAVVIVLIVAASVLPRVIHETRELARRIPGYAASIHSKAEAWIANPPAPLRDFLQFRFEPAVTNAPVGTNVVSTNGTPVTTPAPADSNVGFDRGTVQSAAAWAASLVPKIGSWLLDQVTRVAGWFGFIAGLALIPVYAFYFMLEKRSIERQWADYLPMHNSAFKDELVWVLQSINGYLIVFFRSQVLVALCDGAMYTIGFLAIGLNYAFLLGAIATVLTIIPFLGAIVTCTAALILAFVQYGDWLHPALVLGVFAVVQTLEGFVIAPKIIGDRVGLHPLTIIIAVMVGTTLMGGIIGGILAIPLTAALRVIMFRYVWKPRPDSGLIVRP